MFKALLERRRDDEGFTLIELMVVVLIIGILIAIALPTFLGARRRAQDRAAQSGLRNAIAAAKTAFTDTDDYTGATVAGMTAIEPSLGYVAAPAASTGPKVISISDGGYTANIAADSWAAAALSDSGTCFWINDVSTDPGAGTFYGQGAPCDGGATGAQTAAGGQW